MNPTALSRETKEVILMSFWDRGKPDKAQSGRSDMASSQQERAKIPLPAETFEDTDVLLAYHRQIQSWADEAYEDFVKKGGIELLPGKGKPLVIPTGDVFESIVKNVKVAPPWVMLRKHVKELMQQAIALIDADAPQEAVDELVNEINESIKQMNLQAPSLSLHRRKVTRQTIHEQMEKWV
jgi:hypothetical protein